MWQITWMLSLLPDWFWILFLIAGVAAYFLARFFAVYKLPLRLGGLAATILSVWMLGAASNEAKWEAKIKELEDRLLVAEQESKKENVVIQEKIVYKDKIIREKGKTQIEYIDRVVKEREEVKVFIEQCPIPPVIIEEHNKAAVGAINEAAKGGKK
jgi:hypothetical protein